MVYRTLRLAQAHVRTDLVLKVPPRVEFSKDRTGMIEFRLAAGLPPLIGPVTAPTGWDDGPPSSGCLNKFTRLGDASDSAILKFAQKWGALGFCSHSLPGIHGSCTPALLVPTPPSPFPFFGTSWQESTEDWRSLARHLRAVQEAANATTAGRSPDFDDWRLLRWPLPPVSWGFGFESPAPTERAQRDLDHISSPQAPPASGSGVSLVINRLLEWARIEPTVHFEESEYWISFDFKRPTDEAPAFAWPGETLFPALIAQLVSAVTSEFGVRCSQCGELFLWEERYPKAPRSDRGAYCSDACKKAVRKEQNAACMRRSRA